MPLDRLLRRGHTVTLVRMDVLELPACRNDRLDVVERSGMARLGGTDRIRDVQQRDTDALEQR
jgi:hypothetical protein